MAEEKQLDDRASVMSISSTKAERELEASLAGIVKTLKFYKFRAAHIPFFFLILFLVILGICSCNVY